MKLKMIELIVLAGVWISWTEIDGIANENLNKSMFKIHEGNSKAFWLNKN